MSNIKCPSCGSPNVEQIDTNKYACPYCGTTFNTTPTEVQYSQQPEIEESDIEDEIDDSPSVIISILCFLVPFVGLIHYLLKRSTKPDSAKTYLKWAAIGFILNIILIIAQQ